MGATQKRGPAIAIMARRTSEDKGRFRVSVRRETGAVQDRERLAARIGVSMSAIEAFCDRWEVGELALFGSVLRDDFGPDSDVDVLIRFKSVRTPGLFGMAGMQEELADLFARNVYLVSRAAIKGSRNYIRRKAILESARVVYATRRLRVPAGNASRRS